MKILLKNIFRVNNILTALFFIGLISQIIAIDLFRKTIVELKFTMGIYILVGMIGLFASNKILKKYYLNFFHRIIFSIVFFGGTTIALILFINYHFASKEVFKKEYKIVEKSSLPGRKYHRNERKPTVYIIVNNIKKEIVYPYLKTLEAKKSKYVSINKSKGFLGFDIIRNTELE